MHQIRHRDRHGHHDRLSRHRIHRRHPRHRIRDRLWLHDFPLAHDRLVADLLAGDAARQHVKQALVDGRLDVRAIRAHLVVQRGLKDAHGALKARPLRLQLHLGHLERQLRLLLLEKGVFLVHDHGIVARGGRQGLAQIRLHRVFPVLLHQFAQFLGLIKPTPPLAKVLLRQRHHRGRGVRLVGRRGFRIGHYVGHCVLLAAEG